MRILLPLMLFLTGCSFLPSELWSRTGTKGFTYSLPPSLNKTSLQGAEPGFAQYTNDDMTITFNIGAFAGDSLDSLSHYQDYTSETGHIGKAEVQIVTFDIPPGGGHRFNYGMAASYKGMGLTIYAHCKTPADYNTAVKIFKSVRPKPVKPGVPPPAP